MVDEGGSSSSREDDESSGPASGRTTIAHADGYSVEVGDPFCLEGGEWICVAKLMGREERAAAEEAAARGDSSADWLEGDAPVPSSDGMTITHTMFLAQGHGRSAEEAVKDALSQVDQVRKAPDPRIRRRSSLPPVPRDVRAKVRARDAATVPPPSSSNPPPPAKTTKVEITAGPAAEDAGALKWLSRLFKRG